MVDLDTLLQPVFDDSPEPTGFPTVRARAARLRRRRLARTLFATILVVATAGGAVAVATRTHPPNVNVLPPATAPPPGLRIGTPATVSKTGIDMISAFGSIWVTQPDRVARFDTTSGRLIATIAVPGTSDFRNLAAGAGSVWVDDAGTETVTRIDPSRNAVAATIPMRESVFVVDGLAFVDGKLWVVRPVPDDETRGDVVSIDPATNKVSQRAIIPRTFDVMTAGTHALWYVHGTDLVRFDTTTLRVTIVRHDVKAALAAEHGQVWLLTASGVVEADELTGAQLGPPIPAPNAVNLTVAVGPSAVWIAGQPDSSHGGTVTPFDLVTHRPLASSAPVSFPIISMSALDTAVWVDAGGITHIPYAVGATTAPTPAAANDDVLIFDDGYDGVLAVDPTTKIAARRVVTGQRAGDQPFRSLLTSGTLIVGWDDVYATPIATGVSRFIGKGVVIPSEDPGRVWLTPFGSGPPTYRLVDLDGHVVLETQGLKSTALPVAIPGGLAFAGNRGIELWDAPRRPRHGHARDRRCGAGHVVRDDARVDSTRSFRPAADLDRHSGRARRETSDPSDGCRRLRRAVLVRRPVLGGSGEHQGRARRRIRSRRHRRRAGPCRAHDPAVPAIPTFAWSPDGASLYLGSYGYQQRTMTVRRVDVATGHATDAPMPFGGGITFRVVSGRDAGILLQGTQATPSDCSPPGNQPSGRAQPCRFQF